MKVYHAAPLFTPEQKRVLWDMEQTFESLGLDYFSPAKESAPIWKGRAPAACEPWERRAVVASNASGIDDCDLVVAWLGGWDPAKAVHDEVLLQLELCNFIGEDAHANLIAGLHRYSPSLPDVGVTWELGYAHAKGIPVLAYLHDGEERQFNLMISETVDGTARGLQELYFQLKNFRDGGTIRGGGTLQSEGEDFAG